MEKDKLGREMRERHNEFWYNLTTTKRNDYEGAVG
jgi:hypothetical protein